MICKPVCLAGLNNEGMSTLKDRLEEIMRVMEWRNKDVERISGQTSSVVSQWLGGGSKIIKRIGKMEAAQKLGAASGYSALWIATGAGAKMETLCVSESTGGYMTPARVLGYLGEILQRMDPNLRGAFADVLTSWAAKGGPEDRIPALLVLIDASERSRAVAQAQRAGTPEQS